MIAEARAIVTAALDAGGVRAVDAGDAVAPPCVVIAPGDDWLQPLSRRLWTLRWRLWCVSGRADQGARADELDALAESVVAALSGLRELTTPTFGAWATVTFGNIAYTAVPADIEQAATYEEGS